MPEPHKAIIAIIGVPLLLLPMRATLAQLAETNFASVPCHVAFTYPSTWEVVRDTVDPQSDCNFLIRPKDWQQRLVSRDSVDLYTISLRSVAGDPATAAPDNGFERRGSRWVILGETNQPADTVSGPGWRGWHGLASARCYRVNGPYSGQCDMPTAIVGNTTRSVVLVAGTQAEDVFDRLLRTLQLE
jgi:hypothetical protein